MKSVFFIALQLTAIIVCIALFEPFSSLDFTLPYVFVFGPVFVVVRIFIRHLLPANRFIEYMANKCTMHTNNGAGTYTCTPSTATPFAIKAIFMRLANLLAINFPSHCGRLVNINNVSNDERHTPRFTNACRIWVRTHALTWFRVSTAFFSIPLLHMGFTDEYQINWKSRLYAGPCRKPNKKFSGKFVVGECNQFSFCVCVSFNNNTNDILMVEITFYASLIWNVCNFFSYSLS